MSQEQVWEPLDGTRFWYWNSSTEKTRQQHQRASEAICPLLPFFSWQVKTQQLLKHLPSSTLSSGREHSVFGCHRVIVTQFSWMLLDLILPVDRIIAFILHMTKPKGITISISRANPVVKTCFQTELGWVRGFGVLINCWIIFLRKSWTEQCLYILYK